MQTRWFLPDDALEHLVHPDTGALRILKEQLAFDATQPSLSYIETFKGNDESWHPVFHYKLELPESPKLSFSADIEKAEWSDLKKPSVSAGSSPPRLGLGDFAAYNRWRLR